MKNERTPRAPTNQSLVNKKSFYRELSLRGYHYLEEFQPVRSTSYDGSFAKIEFNGSWVTFLEGLLQVYNFSCDRRDIFLPKRIRRITIHPDLESDSMEVVCDKKQGQITCDGVELSGLHLISLEKQSKGICPILKTFKFIQNSSSKVTVFEKVSNEASADNFIGKVSYYL